MSFTEPSGNRTTTRKMASPVMSSAESSKSETEFSHSDSSFSDDNSVVNEEGKIDPYSFEPQYNEHDLEANALEAGGGNEGGEPSRLNNLDW